MAKQNEHGKLIAAAAKAALAPLGCRRIGQSRTWISDHGAWVVMIEFQPSAWEKGTYLNVWPSWLWLRMGSGDADIRVGEYIPFESVQQFEPLVKELAEQGARTVLELRRRFRTLSDINAYFAGRVAGEGFPVYRAAMTAGLLGDITSSRNLLRRLKDWPPIGLQWQQMMQEECAAMAKLLDDPRQGSQLHLSRS